APELMASVGVPTLSEGILERVAIPGLAFDVHRVAGKPARSGAAGGSLPAAVGREGHDDVGPSLCRVAGDLPAGSLPRTGSPQGMVGPSFGRGRRLVRGTGRERQTCGDDDESQERTSCHGVLPLVLVSARTASPHPGR